MISFSRPSNCGASRSTILVLRVSVACSRVCLSAIDMTSLSSAVADSATAAYTSSL